MKISYFQGGGYNRLPFRCFYIGLGGLLSCHYNFNDIFICCQWLFGNFILVGWPIKSSHSIHSEDNLGDDKFKKRVDKTNAFIKFRGYSIR